METESRWRDLLEKTPNILEEWEERVRVEVPSAHDEDRRTLRNHLPDLLASITEAMVAATGVPSAPVETDMGERHGEERAYLHSYSLEEVLAEYYILQRTVFEFLETESPWPPASATSS